jgi:protein-S-isoprenylcysteine O-methyltransferase Ste14
VHDLQLKSLLLFLRAALWTVLFPGVVAGYIPWQLFGVRDAEVSSPADIPALVLIGTGVLILLSSIVEFARRGKGTLSPVDPPTRLVIQGPYRWVRNPMYAGVLFVLAGEALLTANIGLVGYAATFFVITSVFIALFEEPYLERVFGSSYAQYKANVRRWLPRLSPWRGDTTTAHDLIC